MSHVRRIAAVMHRELVGQRRGRLIWWGALLTGVGVLGVGATREQPLAAINVGAFLLVLVVSALVTGRIGDDLERGALQLDLLAGASSLTIVLGTVAGVLLAATPSAGLAIALTWPALRQLSAADAALLGALFIALASAWAALGATLGAIFTGKANAALLFPLATVGALAPASLPLQSLPAPLAELTRQLWSALPLTHHVSAVASAVVAGAPLPVANLTIVAAGAVLLPMAAAFVLELRIASGRWNG